MKRKMYLLIMMLTVICTLLMINIHPRFIFEQGENFVWNIIRSVILSGMISILLIGIIIFYLNRQKVKPYIQKFNKFKPLLFQLVRRDFLAKYKRSVLGVLWSILNPLLTMMVMTVVFSSLFRFDIDNYPVYLLSGNIVFTMFNEITNQCLYSVLGAAPLMKKVNVPKYIFPLSRALSSLINFVFSYLALMIVMRITNAIFYPTMFFSIIPVFYVFVFSTGIGLILSSAMVFFRDISYLYGIFMTAVTYFTPLFYPISIIPNNYRWVISLNPLYHFVECFRSCVIYGGLPTLWQNIVCFFLAVSSLMLGLFVFYRSQDNFILHI